MNAINITATTTAPVCTRDDYGMIRTAPADLSASAADLIARAARNGSIPARFDNISFTIKGGRSKAEGRALHHEVYQPVEKVQSDFCLLRKATAQGGLAKTRFR